MILGIPWLRRLFVQKLCHRIGRVSCHRLNELNGSKYPCRAVEKGLDYDIRKDIYNKVQGMKFADVKAFHEKYVKDKSYNIAVIGDENKINFRVLNKYGKVVKLSLDELFGYEDYNPELLN